MNLKETYIQYLIWWRHGRKTIFTNVHTEFGGGFEIDAMHITNSNRAYFYEIKTSIYDFKADIEKKRHKLLLNRSDKISIKPKYFYYVCHGFEILPEDVPEYSGLLVCSKSGLKKTKDAPILWDNPLSSEQLLFLYKKILHRYISKKFENWKELKKDFNK